MANEFASNLVMNKNDYQMFVNAGDYTLNSIKRFSKQQNIPHYMTIGRMQKDGILEYNQYYNEIPQYIWSIRSRGWKAVRSHCRKARAPHWQAASRP